MGPWNTNALNRIADLARLHDGLQSSDIDALVEFSNRLAIDPFDIVLRRDHTGEFFCRIGPSSTFPDHDLVCGYRIDQSSRIIDVISFATVPARTNA